MAEIVVAADPTLVSSVSSLGTSIPSPGDTPSGLSAHSTGGRTPLSTHLQAMAEAFANHSHSGPDGPYTRFGGPSQLPHHVAMAEAFVNNTRSGPHGPSTRSSQAPPPRGILKPPRDSFPEFPEEYPSPQPEPLSRREKVRQVARVVGQALATAFCVVPSEKRLRFSYRKKVNKVGKWMEFTWPELLKKKE